MSHSCDESFPHLQIVTSSCEVRMDCETPVSLYLKHAAEKNRNFILESAEQGVTSGRFSFIGWDPILTTQYKNGLFTITGACHYERPTPNPFQAMKRFLANVELLDSQHIPNSRGGFVGHFNYDAIRAYEDIGPCQENNSAWFDLFLPNSLLVLDHLNHCVSVFCHELVQDSPDRARKIAATRMEKIISKTKQFSIANTTVAVSSKPVSFDQWTSNISKETFCEMVGQAKQNIIDGDIFQVVLSRAVRRTYTGDPFEIYRALRQINPSPYMYFLKSGDDVVVGGSPEALVTVDRGVVSTKPIAGTRWRGKTLEEDQRLESDLLADQKEIAEHVMLVDLGRNDLGRIAKPGSVKVPHFMQIERFSHVMHIVSIVKAKLKDELHPLDALMSAFPAGTLTGAPKIRAMQIINDLEPEGRGVYGGAIGFVDVSGNLDSCIAIRTATVSNGMVRCQAGAGIVADSDPEKEFDETKYKLLSMVTAVERALAVQSTRNH